MSRWFSYLNSATAILTAYTGEEPFASFVKKYFSQHKKYGGKDRKQISHLCYCFFRLGKALTDMPIAERIVAGLFLCSNEGNDLLAELNSTWNDKATLPLRDKLALINNSVSLDAIFPWKEEISKEIDFNRFVSSFFIQPDMFLRLRPGKEEVIKKKLIAAIIHFKNIDATCLSLPAGAKLDDIISINKEAVIQDHSSQRVGEFMEEVTVSREKDSNKIRVWDCCAASGGKSIMAFDILKNIELEVSDVRESILINLKKRFAEAGITRYKSFVADLSKSLTNKLQPFDFIIADVPCTGSGTWSRTPEQLYYFDQSKIETYAALQKKIVATAISYLKPGGYLLYITCSVFNKENEEAVSYIQQNFATMKVVKMELLKGYNNKADTLFAALLQRSL